MFHTSTLYPAAVCLLTLGATASGEVLQISASVGSGGVNNPADVKRVQERLISLGLSWVEADGAMGPITISAIKLFQSIKNGRTSVGGNGRVDVNGDTHKWLEAANAPRWIRMSADGMGFKNIELLQKDDDHDYGTDWLDTTIRRAAVDYQQAYRSQAHASLITVNDASPAKGGDTPDHTGHETGLDIDLRLPKKNHGGAVLEGRTYRSADYDQAAAREIIKAFRKQDLVDKERIFFNDPTLIAEGICMELEHHDNHIHIGIHPPKRSALASKLD